MPNTLCQLCESVLYLPLYNFIIEETMSEHHYLFIHYNCLLTLSRKKNTQIITTHYLISIDHFILLYFLLPNGYDVYEYYVPLIILQQLFV